MRSELVGKNSAGRMYGLTAFCPIKLGTPDEQDRSRESLVRETLAGLAVDEDSLFARVPDTYFARFYVLKDVFYESRPAKQEHLKSQYLIFVTDFHGDLRPHLRRMWDHAEDEIRKIWEHCVAFHAVDAAGFASYIERCQVDNALVFNGSTDEPLAEQLKGLYLKQQFGEFAATHQGLPPAELRQRFREFLGRVRIDDLAGPTWRPGACSLTNVTVD